MFTVYTRLCLSNLINYFLEFSLISRHIHIGPQLTSLIFMSKNHLESTQGFDFGTICDFIPLLTCDNVIFLCYNALKTHIVNLTQLPHNIVLVPYGFQVKKQCL